MNRVAVVAGMRTPFVKSGKAFKDLGPLRLARESVRGLLETHEIVPESIDSLVYGVVDAIQAGRIECGIAGGVDSLSHSDPNTFNEPSTGLSMGQHTELTRKEWNISRARQDEIALASHENAVAARDKLSKEIYPVLGVEHGLGSSRGDVSRSSVRIETGFRSRRNVDRR